MSLPAAVIDALVATGCTAEQLAAAVKAANAEAEAKAAERRANDAARKRRQRANGHAMSHDVTRTDADSTDTLSSPEVSPQTPFPNPSNPKTPSPPKGGSVPAGFDRFWAMFPNRVGKADAVKAFAKAAQRVDLETMLAGLERYVGKTDDRPWCNPSTWLNQDRWDDQPANVLPMARGSPAFGFDAFLGAVIDQQERNDERPDAEIEGYPPAARAIR